MNPRIRIEPAVSSGAHRGLLLDKFLTVKSAGGGDSHAPALGAIALAGSVPVYKLAYERWLEVAKGMTCAVRVKGRIRGRLAIGLGNEPIP